MSKKPIKWAKEQELTAEVEFVDSTRIVIKNFRDFIYDKNGIKRELFDTITIDANKVNTAWYVVVPFGFFGMAHTFIVFDCGDRHLAISFEARRENDIFNPLSGLLGRYEFVGIVGSERDLMQLRVVTRNEAVHVYPLKTNTDQTKVLFTNLMKSVQMANIEKKSYHTFLNNCTTALMKELNKIGMRKIGFSWKAVFPEFSAKLLHDLGYIDNSVEYKEYVVHANISQKVMTHQDHPEFSRMIRI